MADDEDIPDYEKTVDATEDLPVRPTFDPKYPINSPDLFAVPDMGITDGKLVSFANAPLEPPKYLIEYTDTLGATSKSWIGQDRIKPAE